MNRLKLLAAVALLGIPLAACEETTPPPPVGSIVGTVAIEGTGIDGVSVNLSNGNTTTTAGGGSYRFDNVEGGAYTVTISGFPSDATFDATSAAATISSAGQSVTVNFSGAYIRTASVMGTVTVENTGLGGVAVALSGVSGATATTDDNGQYAFTGLRMGNYSVEISGFDNDEIGFSNTAASVTVGVGESKIISFDGTYLRTAGIMGRVSVEGEGLEGVMISLAGGPDNTDMTTMTDAAGQYSFAKLRAGAYAVGISGYNTDDYEFEATSMNVTVALGETANVPFEGVLLRTSGVSGRVSVEGIGLEGVMVTLSAMDMDDMTAMTDAGGLYAFSGLAAGDYTVAIALSDEQMTAYVFDMTSMDVTVGDDDTQIVNFEAEHAATAKVTVQLFVDEGTKNDMMDEGEMAFPTAAMLQMVAELGLPLALPISLAGPGVLDMQQGMAMPDGSVVFSGLKAGNYQVLVSDIPAEVLAGLPPALAAVLQDYSYGGPATGYPIALGVGAMEMQYAPVDITHTTVNFAVTLKGGDHRGMGVPGATVDLYADAMGETKVGSGTTMVNEAGHAYTSIRFARAGTTGNTVHMGVSTDDYWVDPTAGMQAVMWNPMSPVHPAPDAMPPAVLNDANILNLEVDVTVSGATITTAYGGGKPLSFWDIDVMMGDSAVADAPAMLDTLGMAAFSDTVAAGDLPVTYTFAVDTVQANTRDGGEKFEGTTLEHMHTGLSLAGTMDAGMIEVAYTTQTLKVYVHHERDQVEGYTGNILGGDVRSSAGIEVDIRHIDDNGRSRAFTSADKISTPSNNGANGVWTFNNVPADAKVIVQADEAADAGNIMLLDPDELAAYTDMDANGITGGAFGSEGGFSHTVSLCPLMSVDPTAQDHGECGSFAYVNTYSVSGLVWKRQVVKGAAHANDDSFTTKDPVFVADISVALDPVEGKNLAGDSESATTTKDPVRTAGETSKGTEVLDETHQFDFGQMAAGVYKISVSDGWRYRMGAKGTETLLGGSLDPLASDLAIDVTPATGIVYGYVRDSEEFPVADATVSVNGVNATTDVHGRYIAEGIAPQTRRINNVWYRNMIFVETAETGNKATREIIGFAANSPIQQDIELSGVGKTASIGGTVTASGSGAPVAGAVILVDDAAPNNAATRGVNAGKLVTGADGTYTAIVPAKALGETARVTVSKAGMSFVPAALDAPAHAGAEISGIDFAGFLHATIRGRVKNPDGNAMGDVTVTATNTGSGEVFESVTSTGNARGTFALSVPFGTYEIEASADGYSFSYPNNNQTVSVAPGQQLDFGDIQAAAVQSSNATLSALTLSGVTLNPAFASDVTAYTATVGYSLAETTVDPTASSSAASVAIEPADADAATDGHQAALAVGANTITVTVTAEDGSTMAYSVAVTRDAAPSSDATLSSLSLSGVTLDPAFDAATTAYTASVGNDVAQTTVEATASHSAASATIDPVDAEMVMMGHQVNLAVGPTTVTVTVTAEDGTTQDYTVAVTRAQSSDATLSALSLSDVTLNPAFAGDVNAYTATVGYTTESTTVAATANSGMASAAIVPADADANTAGHQVNVRVGRTDITVRVTAEDGSEMDYSVAVTRDAAPSADASLSDLSLSGATLTPAFSGALNYTASVENDVAQTTVTATQRHSAARVAIMPGDDDAATDGWQVDLDVGDTDIMVRVTAEDDTEQTYSVKVTRAASSDASLSSLSLSDVTLAPDFASDERSYTASVEYEVMSTTVEAMANSGEADVTIVPADADANTAGDQVGLSVGDNTITVIVTAEDGTRQDYVVTVTRMAQSSDVSLDKFVVNDGTSDTDVMADANGAYAHSVGYDVMQATVSATAGHADAMAAITSPADADANTAGHQVDLAVGGTDVTATVTAEDGTTMEYTLTVTRAQSSDVSLDKFTVNDGTADADVMADANGDYAHGVGYDVMQVTVSATAAHADASVAITSPADADADTDGHQVDLAVGGTDVTATVTAQDGTTMDYTLTVTRAASSDMSLSSVMVNDEEITAGDDGTYATDVGNDVSMATIAATATHDDANVTYSGDDADMMTDGHQAALDVGANTITITVTAGDGMTADYMLTITRAAAPGIMISSTDVDDDGNPTIALGEGEMAAYLVNLGTEPTARVTVTITAASGLTANKANLVFEPENWNIQQGVEITADEDNTDYADAEDLVVGHAAESEDANYGGDTDANPVVPAKTQDVTVDVTDDDVEARQLTVTVGTGDDAVATNAGGTATLEVDENADGGGSFTVELGAGEGEAATGKPLGDVMVAITVPDDANFSLSAEELTFTPDNFRTPQTVTVTPDDDMIAMTEVAHALALAATGGGYTDDAPVDGEVEAQTVTVNVTITEDDEAGLTVSPTGLQLVEGTSGTYTVKLDSDPDGVVVIAVGSSDAAATVAPPTLTFDASDWSDEQTVTVTAPDNEATGNGSATISHTVVAQAGNGYSNGAVADAAIEVTVVDDETAQIVLTPPVLTIVQGGSQSYTVGLTQAPATGETVTISVSAAAGLNVTAGAVLTFNAGNWETAQIVTIGVPASTAAATLTVTHGLDTDGGDSPNYTDAANAGSVSVTVEEPSS